MRGRARDTGPRSRVAKGAGARDCVPRLDAERILRVVREGARQQGHLLLAVDSARPAAYGTKRRVPVGIGDLQLVMAIPFADLRLVVIAAQTLNIVAASTMVSVSVNVEV